MDSLLKKAKHLLSFLFYRILLAQLPAGRPSGHVDGIAIICTASLGDFVVSCSAARELFRQGKRLILICREGIGIEEFAKLTGYFKEVIAFPHSFHWRIGNIRRLRKICVHTVMVMPPERHILSDLYALSIVADERIFPDTLQGCSLPGLKRITDHYADKLVPIHVIQQQKQYEEYLKGAGLYDGAILPFVFNHKKVLREKQTQPYIMVFPGASGGKAKQWPVERFAYVAAQLYKKTSCRVLICGTEGEKALGQKLYRLLPIRGENLCGKTTIPELEKLFRGTLLVLANDSGSAHLSIAFGAPTVIICGGWEYGRFYPNPSLPRNCVAMVAEKEELSCIPCGKSCPECTKQGAAQCVLKITAKAVEKAVQSYILATWEIREGENIWKKP